MPQVEAFINKSRSVAANVAVIVSRSGFTKNAIALAKENAIGTLSLLPSDSSDAGFRIGYQSYVRIFQWARIEVNVEFNGKVTLDEPLNIDSIEYEGRRVVDWFQNLLATEHAKTVEVGWLKCMVTFDTPKLMSVNGIQREVVAMQFSALRQVNIKTKFQNISGQAFYDWQQGSWQLPSGGFLIIGEINPSFEDWINLDGEIPDHVEGSFAMNLDVFRRLDPKPDALDLSQI